MAKYCKNCGARVDSITGLCRKCDEDEIVNLYLKDQEQKRKIRKRIKCILIALLVLGALLAGVLALNYFEVIDLPDWGIDRFFRDRTKSTAVEETVEPLPSAPPTTDVTVPETEAPVPTEPLYTLTFEYITLTPVESPVLSCSASSTRSGDKVTHDVMNLLDGNKETNWTEGVSGDGIGEYVYFDFEETYLLKSIRIRGGNRRDHLHFTANSRPARITMTFSDGTSESFTMHDVYESQVLTLSKPVMTSSLQITLDSVYAGNKYQDTVISDVFFEAYEVRSGTEEFPTNIKSCTSIKLERLNDITNLKESAVITGYDNAGDELWSYQSGEYDLAQCAALEVIDISGSTLYFAEAGTVIALNLKDGAILWENDGFNGYPSAHTFDENGTLYLCGFLSPELYVIDTNGKTVHDIATFDSSFFWPYDIVVDDGYARISMDAHPDQIKDEDSVIVVDLSDYSYKLPQA